MEKTSLVLAALVLLLSSSLLVAVTKVSLLERQVATLNTTVTTLKGGDLIKYAPERMTNETMVDLDDPEMSHGTHEWNNGRRSVLDEDSGTEWKQHTFERHGVYGYVKFGGYRVGSAEFATIGLGALAQWGHRNLRSCQWQGNNGEVLNGTAQLIHGLEHHGLAYHVIIVWCHLSKETTHGVGGKLYLSMDYEKYVVYAEEDGQFQFSTPRRPFMRNVTHCSPPIHHGVHNHLVKAWLDYHMTMGIDHFVMYDVGGIDAKMKAMLQPYIDVGVVEITDFKEIQKFPSWYYGQVLIINDCLYRFRFSSRWVAYIDYDEYMWVQDNKTLQDIFEQYKDKAYIQHGTVLWRTQKCLAREGSKDPRNALERAVFRSAEPFCRDPKLHKPTCFDYWGHRKFFANPRRLVLVENHRVVDPADQGVSLSTDVMLHQHLRGLVTHGFQQCNETYGPDEKVPGYVKDTSIADIATRLRENPPSLEEWTQKKQAWEDHVKEEWKKLEG